MLTETMLARSMRAFSIHKLLSSPRVVSLLRLLIKLDTKLGLSIEVPIDICTGSTSQWS